MQSINKCALPKGLVPGTKKWAGPITTTGISGFAYGGVLGQPIKREIPPVVIPEPAEQAKQAELTPQGIVEQYCKKEGIEIERHVIDDDSVAEVIDIGLQPKRPPSPVVKPQQDAHKEVVTASLQVKSISKPIVGNQPARRLCMGVDPGTAQMGVAWLDPMMKKLIMLVVDVKHHGGYVYDVNEMYMKAKAVALVVQWEPYLKSTRVCHIEDMTMPQANKTVKKFVLILEQTIRARHPEIEMHLTDPRNWRELFGTHGDDYDDRKLRSLVKMAEILGDDGYKAAAAAFVWPGCRKVLYDGFEAGLYALYGHCINIRPENPFGKPKKKATRPDGLQHVAKIRDEIWGVSESGKSKLQRRFDKAELIRVAKASKVLSAEDIDAYANGKRLASEAYRPDADVPPAKRQKTSTKTKASKKKRATEEAEEEEEEEEEDEPKESKSKKSRKRQATEEPNESRPPKITKTKSKRKQTSVSPVPMPNVVHMAISTGHGSATAAGENALAIGLHSTSTSKSAIAFKPELAASKVDISKLPPMARASFIQEIRADDDEIIAVDFTVPYSGDDNIEDACDTLYDDDATGDSKLTVKQRMEKMVKEKTRARLGIPDDISYGIYDTGKDSK